MKQCFISAVFSVAAAFAADNALQDAADALRAIKSVTKVGVHFRDYLARLLDAKVELDRYTATPVADDTALRANLQGPMRFYELASKVW